jgi:hypothetical protein
MIFSCDERAALGAPVVTRVPEYKMSKGTVAASALSLAAGLASAGVVTERIDFFPDEPGTRTLQLRFIGPQEGRIVRTRVYMDFTTQPGFDAGTINFLFLAPVPDSPGGGFLTLTGEGLNWQGEGRFVAEYETDELNGEIVGGLWVFDLGSLNDPPSFSGAFSESSRVEVDIEVPDPPPCPADFNADGGVDGADVEAFYTAWQESMPEADVNADGGVDGSDVETFFLAWEAGGC